MHTGTQVSDPKPADLPTSSGEFGLNMSSCWPSVFSNLSGTGQILKASILGGTIPRYPLAEGGRLAWSRSSACSLTTGAWAQVSRASRDMFPGQCLEGCGGTCTWGLEGSGLSSVAWTSRLWGAKEGGKASWSFSGEEGNSQDDKKSRCSVIRCLPGSTDRS